MMNRNILALVIPALLAAGAANAAEVYNKDGNKLDIYGLADGRHQFSNSAANDGDETYVRLGFKGLTQINSQLSGYGQFEYNYQGNHVEGSQKGNGTRLAFAGLKMANYGSFDYGRNYGIVYDVESFTDVLPVFGGDSYTNTDNFMTQRANGLATYRNTDFFGMVKGLNFGLQYQGKNQNDGRIVSQQNGDGFGFSTSYNVGYGLTLAGAYANSNRTLAQQKDGNGEKAQVWTVGAQYNANNVYFAAMYAETLNMTPFGEDSAFANKTQNFETTLQYTFDFGLTPEVSYLQSRGSNLNGYGYSDTNQNLVKYVSLGATYAFNKNMSTYVDYKVNLLKSDEFHTAASINTDDIVGVGVKYQF